MTATVGSPRSRSPGAKVDRREMPTALFDAPLPTPPPFDRKEVLREVEEEEEFDVAVVPPPPSLLLWDDESLLFLLLLLGTRMELEGWVRPLIRASLWLRNVGAVLFLGVECGVVAESDVVDVVVVVDDDVVVVVAVVVPLFTPSAADCRDLYPESPLREDEDKAPVAALPRRPSVWVVEVAAADFSLLSPVCDIRRPLLLPPPPPPPPLEGMVVMDLTGLWEED